MQVVALEPGDAVVSVAVVSKEASACHMLLLTAGGMLRAAPMSWLLQQATARQGAVPVIALEVRLAFVNMSCPLQFSALHGNHPDQVMARCTATDGKPRQAEDELTSVMMHRDGCCILVLTSAGRATCVDIDLAAIGGAAGLHVTHNCLCLPSSYALQTSQSSHSYMHM